MEMEHIDLNCKYKSLISLDIRLFFINYIYRVSTHNMKINSLEMNLKGVIGKLTFYKGGLELKNINYVE